MCPKPPLSDGPNTEGTGAGQQQLSGCSLTTATKIQRSACSLVPRSDWNLKQCVLIVPKRASGWRKERVPMNPQGWALRTSLFPALLLQGQVPEGSNESEPGGSSSLKVLCYLHLKQTNCWFFRSKVRRRIFYSVLPEKKYQLHF